MRFLGDWRFEANDDDPEMTDAVAESDALVRSLAEARELDAEERPDVRRSFNDRISGGHGNDLIFGMQGNDRIAGNRGEDRLYGGRGNDSIRGGAGNDTILGGVGNDRLSGGLGNDRMGRW